MTTNTPTIVYIIVALIVVAIVVAVAVAVSRRSKTSHLSKRFGPEYDRLVRETGSREEAERELARREERSKKFHLEELPAGARSRYADEWREVPSRFVDEPRAAVVQADALVVNVMRDRGYPMADFDQRVADISSDHPSVVANYRAAHDVSARSEGGEVPTEDLRQAMVHYRALFSDLLGDERKPK